jgi:3-oxoacyl-[acyl-carrier protein] reductase
VTETPVALVTGAGRGIGRAIAGALAVREMQVILSSRSVLELETARASMAHAERHLVEPADLAVEADIYRLTADLKRQFAALDLLVLNAGTAVSAPLEETTLEQWDRVFAVNVRAPFLLVRELLPLLRAACGRIVVIGSVVSTAAYPHQGAYTASKHALFGLSKVMARELHRDGILVHTILPGGVDTGMVRSMRPDIDTGDLIVPDEIAAAVTALLDMGGNAVVDEIRMRRRSREPWQ